MVPLESGDMYAHQEMVLYWYYWAKFVSTELNYDSQ